MIRRQHQKSRIIVNVGRNSLHLYSSLRSNNFLLPTKHGQNLTVWDHMKALDDNKIIFSWVSLCRILKNYQYQTGRQFTRRLHLPKAPTPPFPAATQSLRPPGIKIYQIGCFLSHSMIKTWAHTSMRLLPAGTTSEIKCRKSASRRPVVSWEWSNCNEVWLVDIIVNPVSGVYIYRGES